MDHNQQRLVLGPDDTSLLLFRARVTLWQDDFLLWPLVALRKH